MRKFLVNVQFYGKQYLGFQINGKTNTVQLAIETALQKLFGQHIKISGCSRLDAGVSAKVFLFTFFSDTKLPADRVAFKLNRFLPNDIKCQKSEEVPLNFNVRDNILSKTYKYSLYFGSHIMPLLNRSAVFVQGDLNLKNMKNCANVLVGKHNYKSFCNSSPETQNYIKTISDIKIDCSENMIDIYITADNFLYNMVRVIVGTLVECGKNKLNETDIQKFFELQDRSKNPAKTMSSKGLMLYALQLKNNITWCYFFKLFLFLQTYYLNKLFPRVLV